MRLVLASRPDAEDRLLSPLIADGHEIVARPASSRELVDALASLRPDAAIVDAGPDLLTANVLSAADDAGVRVVGLVGRVGDRENASALGLRELVDAAGGYSGVREALQGHRDEGRGEAPEAAAAGAGKVVAVWGPTGAPGRTTTAITIASELAADGRRVVLVDADSYGGAIAVRLGLLDEAPGFAAACRLAAVGGFDREQLERVSVPVATGGAPLRVLTGLAQPARWPELSEDRVAAVLTQLRSLCEVAVVDVGFSLESDEEIVSDVFAPRRNASTLATIRAADHVVAVGDGDALGVARLIRGHSDLLALAPEARVSVVVNRVRGGALGAGAAREVAVALDRFAGIRNATLVPDDRAGLDAAQLRELPLRLAAPRSPARAALARHVHRHVLPVLSDAAPDRPGPSAAARPSRFAPSL